MLLHEALHLVFSTFSRQVLQQGRLTNYLADCGVFDTFDDRRTIFLTIDHRYGARLYTCLSRSPYKQQYDAIMQEFIAAHPQFAPDQVQYIFDSVRFAYGKIKRIKLPKEIELFPQPKPKKTRKRKPTTLHNPKRPYTTPNHPSSRNTTQHHPKPYTNHTPPSRRATNPQPKRRTTKSPLIPQWLGIRVVKIVLSFIAFILIAGGGILMTENRIPTVFLLYGIAALLFLLLKILK